MLQESRIDSTGETLTERVGIYIDGANIFFAAVNHFERLGMTQDAAKVASKIEYAQFAKWLAKGRSISQAKYFNSFKPGVNPTNAFFKAVGSLGYQVFLREYKLKDDREHEAGVDIELAIHAVKDALSFDTLVLVTGDIDFLPLMEMMFQFSRKVEIVCFSSSTNARWLEMKKSYPDLELRALEDFYGTDQAEPWKMV